MISMILTVTPAIAAKMAKTPRRTFLIRTKWKRPVSGQRYRDSVTAGTSRPRVEKKSAPTKLMNGSRSGTAMAKRAKQIMMNVRIEIWAKL